jgi:hypothetical protein
MRPYRLLLLLEYGLVLAYWSGNRYCHCILGGIAGNVTGTSLEVLALLSGAYGPGFKSDSRIG